MRGPRLRSPKPENCLSDLFRATLLGLQNYKAPLAFNRTATNGPIHRALPYRPAKMCARQLFEIWGPADILKKVY